MQKHEYAEIWKKKYAEIWKKNAEIWKTYANICICSMSNMMSLPQLHIYAKFAAKICKKICKICKHEISMHNMHLPLF